MSRTAPKPETVLAWAWELKDPTGKWLLCRWSAPSPAQLRGEGRHTRKPSDEARPVCVRMVRNRNLNPRKKQAPR
jgi:hypothetical protein